MPADLAARLDALFAPPVGRPLDRSQRAPTPVPADPAAPAVPRLALVRDPMRPATALTAYRWEVSAA